MSNRIIDRLLLCGIGVLLLAFTGVVAMSLNDHVVKDGDTAPDFSIRADSGRTLTRANFGGKVLILNFWASYCAPCVEEIPSLDQLQRRFASNGLVVLAVSIDKDEQAYRAFLARNPVAFGTARDPDQKINGEYGTRQIPESYIIDSSGRVIKKIVSAENWSDDRVVRYVQSLL